MHTVNWLNQTRYLTVTAENTDCEFAASQITWVESLKQQSLGGSKSQVI